MKRYLVFSGHRWDPRGGWQDLDRPADDLAEARSHAALASEAKDAWWHIVDTETGEIVERS